MVQKNLSRYFCISITIDMGGLSRYFSKEHQDQWPIWLSRTTSLWSYPPQRRSLFIVLPNDFSLSLVLLIGRREMIHNRRRKNLETNSVCSLGQSLQFAEQKLKNIFNSPKRCRTACLCTQHFSTQHPSSISKLFCLFYTLFCATPANNQGTEDPRGYWFLRDTLTLPTLISRLQRTQ